MNTLVLLLISIAVLFCGYVFYGGWVARQWGVNEGKHPTPAHTMEDGVDYVPAKAPILMGHHFSSIAGAGPITGPIGAAMFGWLPVTLWVLIGGIFFGGVHDFGALFASIRHQGKSIGEIDVRKNFKVNIIAVKSKDAVNVSLDSDYRFSEGESLYIIGKDKDIQRYFHTL